MPSLQEFDLHTHTTASDGRMSPRELVTYAQGRLAGLAITDHDTVAGLDEGLAAGREHDFPVIPGIELTTDYGQSEVHILGFFIERREPGFLRLLDDIVAGRVTRARRMVQKLNELGVPLPWPEVKRQARGRFLGRPHIMRALLSAGLLRPAERDSFFRTYLAAGAPAYLPHAEITTELAIHLILDVGGVPVLAHPGRGGGEHLPLLIGWGLAGVEAFHPAHDPGEAIHYAQSAGEAGLIVTGGSDFHDERGGASLGQNRTSLAAVEALARRAAGDAGRAFLSELHISRDIRG